MMTDENAFGVMVSYFAVEDEEYALEREQFVERFEGFRARVREVVQEHPLGPEARALDLGHAWYFEVAEGEQSESPLAWVKRICERLKQHGFDCVAVVTHGGRWVDDGDSSFVSTEHLGTFRAVTLSNPSEPLRRALYADAASRVDEEEPAGWGPGLYLDTEAVEALGIKPKNAPTVLRFAGAEFYRAGR
jgi:hypothetical protein